MVFDQLVRFPGQTKPYLVLTTAVRRRRVWRHCYKLVATSRVCSVPRALSLRMPLGPVSIRFAPAVPAVPQHSSGACVCTQPSGLSHSLGAKMFSGRIPPLLFCAWFCPGTWNQTPFPVAKIKQGGEPSSPSPKPLCDSTLRHLSPGTSSPALKSCCSDGAESRLALGRYPAYRCEPCSDSLYSSTSL